MTEAGVIGAPALQPGELGERVLIVSPHPDDESLGCGGLIALLCRAGRAVQVVMMTDGSGSHPNSAEYPAARLAQVRRAEALEALRILGVAESDVAFWMIPDRYAPMPGMAGFEACVERARRALRDFRPSSLVIPARCDAHGDHRASWAIWQAAMGDTEPSAPGVLEYVVWPAHDTASAAGRRTLDISGVLALKLAAIAAHRSQHGLVIGDDPSGFCLPADLLVRAGRPHENFYEAAA